MGAPAGTTPWPTELQPRRAPLARPALRACRRVPRRGQEVVGQLGGRCLRPRQGQRPALRPGQAACAEIGGKYFQVKGPLNVARSPLAFGLLSGKYENGARPKQAMLALLERFQRYNSPQARRAASTYITLACLRAWHRPGSAGPSLRDKPAVRDQQHHRHHQTGTAG